jgi:hypothetical protein
MATITSPREHASQIDTRLRVHHPLVRLRGYIRAYVLVEGLAVLCLYVALWFWIGLVVDYGFFKTFGIDWVQVLPWALRAVLLGILTGGLIGVVAAKVLFRLFREFRDAALALVLERRFPEELGDRLITAVELADPQKGESYGYSPAMIDRTISEAASRVDHLPVEQVFNWRRLRRAAITVGACTLGIYFLLGISYCAYVAQPRVDEFTARFNNVAAIWFERNILLTNTIWPRRAYLELVNFPASGDLRVGRDAPPPTLQVRAVKWVIADSRAPEGWRPMKWQDLTPELVGGKLVTLEGQTGSLDEIEQRLDNSETQPVFDADTQLALRDILARLHARAESPEMARRVRELTIPEKVLVYYRGETIRSEQTLKKQTDNQYSGVLSDLKESVRFTANGEDYYTPYRTITIVPPPSLVELIRDEERPAYLYQRPAAAGGPEALRGKKQQLKDLPVSLSGSASRFDVPAGTDVVLRGTTDKQLRFPGGVDLRASGGGAAVATPVQQLDGQSFEIRFNNVTSPIDFVFQFTDTDNVVGLRPVMLRPIEDTPPEVDVQVEYLRKTSQGYIITPTALVPFSGKVRDDHGLESVKYFYTLMSVESQMVAVARRTLTAFEFSPRGLGPHWVAAAYLSNLSNLIKTITDEAQRQPEQIAVASFARRLQETIANATPPGTGQSLQENLERNFLRDYTFDPDETRGCFEVERLGLKVTDEQQVQPRYRMRLWVVATDSNIETGPGIGQSKERFSFLIVSENELLLEIAKEEEGLHVKLEDTISKLKDARNKLEQVALELPSLKPEEFSPMAQRVEEILSALVRCWDVTGEISKDYLKILKELRFNRVRPKIIDKIEQGICNPLQDIINQDREFDRADKSMRAFHKTLEDRVADKPAAQQAGKQLDQLIERLTRVLDAMGDINSINKLIERLVQIEKGERRAYERFKELNDELQEKILDQALTPMPEPKEKKPPDK